MGRGAGHEEGAANACGETIERIGATNEKLTQQRGHGGADHAGANDCDVVDVVGRRGRAERPERAALHRGAPRREHLCLWQALVAWSGH